MMAAMALLCLTANAQKARHLPGDITVQPMIGVSEGFLSGNDHTGLGYCGKRI